MTAQCAGCDRFIRGTVEDPIISGKELGWGNYHDACAKTERARRGVSARTKPMKERKTQFRVDCVLVENGKSSAESQWHFLEATMAEAERVCEIAMGAKTIPGLEDLTNKTSKRYVNCTITLILKNGKRTVLDERIHPLARTYA